MFSFLVPVVPELFRMIRRPGAQPQAGPRLRHDNAVAWVSRVVAYLHRLVDTEAHHLVGQAGHVLRAVVRKPREAIAIEQDFRRRRNAVLIAEGSCVQNHAIRNAAAEGEFLAATALDLLGREPVRHHVPPDSSGHNGDTCRDATDESRVLGAK